MNKIYLDYAAATPMDDQVKEAMEPFFSKFFYNPSATYLTAREVKFALEEARANLAHWLGAKPSEIIFTAGGTEANNLAINGVMKMHPKGNLIISGLEHDSVYEPACSFNTKISKVTQDGFVDIDDLISKIDDQTVLISVMQANNEIGTIQPIKEISAVVQKIKLSRLKKGNTTPLYLHTDAAQAANYLDLHTSRLGVDMLSVNGGKIYGPKQSGALFVKGGTELAAQVLGGHQEQGLRSGTPNVPGAIGLAKALEITQTIKSQEVQRLKKLQKIFIESLQNEIPDAKINGSLKNRLPNNIHFMIDNIDNETILIKLDEAGIMASAGSACSASSEEPSKVLKSIGLDRRQIQSSLRFTTGRQTSAQEIEKTVQILSTIVNK